MILLCIKIKLEFESNPELWSSKHNRKYFHDLKYKIRCILNMCFLGIKKLEAGHYKNEQYPYLSTKLSKKRLTMM